MWDIQFRGDVGHPFKTMTPSLTQRLHSVEVPWMLSPSAPFLQLTASEWDHPTTVRFVAFFGLEESTVQPGRTKYVLAKSPHELGMKLGTPGAPYQLVRVKFAGATASRLLPAFSDREVVDPEMYDASGLLYRFAPRQGVQEWIERFQAAWAQNRFCPNPRMYEVSNSLWIDELGLGVEFKHFLLLGRDSYVEIAAKHWDWESEGSIPE